LTIDQTVAKRWQDFAKLKIEIQPTYDKNLSANGDNGPDYSSGFPENESNKTLINEGKSWRSPKVQETNTPICDFEYGRNFGTHNDVHLQSVLPIKFEHNSARSYIFCFYSHPTYDMDSNEEEKKADHIIKLFREPYETKAERSIPFVEGIFIEDE